jgi:D-amino-acid dehydrogenase
MKVLVLGAGVVGVATAYFLARAGHDVEVVERRSAPALETSFANAGLVVPSQSLPWNEPGIPFQALKWLFEEDGTLVIRPGVDPAMWSWLLRFSWRARRRPFLAAARATLPLANLSWDLMRTVAEREGLAYDATGQGVITLVRAPAILDSMAGSVRLLEEIGVEARLLTREETLAFEPSVRPLRDQLAGALLVPGDASGDVHGFACGLATAARSAGARFRFGCTVAGAERRGDRLTGITTSHGRIAADAYVLALGPASGAFARRLGVRLPVYPVKGHSVTVETGGWEGLPRVPVRDRVFKVAVTPLGTRLRVAGMAVLDGGRMSAQPRHLGAMHRALRALFPALPDGLPVEEWTGLRPMTPDGPPILGRCGLDNLFLNVGHGPLGWTLATGSGAVVADLVSGKEPPVPVDGLGYRRCLV